MSSKSVRWRLLKLDVWILLRPFGWTAIAINDRSRSTEVMEASQNRVGGKEVEKDTQKCGENRRKLGHQLDGNDPDDIEGIFYFYHQVEQVTSRTHSTLRNSTFSIPTGQGKS